MRQSCRWPHMKGSGRRVRKVLGEGAEKKERESHTSCSGWGSGKRCLSKMRKRKETRKRVSLSCVERKIKVTRLRGAGGGERGEVRRIPFVGEIGCLKRTRYGGGREEERGKKKREERLHRSLGGVKKKNTSSLAIAKGGKAKRKGGRGTDVFRANASGATT